MCGPGSCSTARRPFPTRPRRSSVSTPVMTLKSALIAIRTCKANESVGYGGTYTAARAHRIGVIACGYADGYPRHAPNGTPVLVCGKKVRTAGRVSMDMMTVDLTEVHRGGGGQPGRALGRGLAGRRRCGRGEHGRLSTAVRGVSARVPVRHHRRSARSTSNSEGIIVTPSSPAQPDSSAPISSRR